MEIGIFDCSDSSYIADFRCYSIMRSEIKLFSSHCLLAMEKRMFMGQLCTYTKKSRRSGSRQPVDRAPPNGFAVQIGLLSQEKCYRVHSLQSEKIHFASGSAVHPVARITFGLIPRSVDSNVGFYCFRRHRFTKE